MEAFISLKVSDDCRVMKQIAVCGVLPAPQPLPEPGEVNICLDGDDAAVRDFLCFLVYRLREGTVVDWKLASGGGRT